MRILFLICMTSIAMVTDIKERKISNKLILVILLSGLFISIYDAQWYGVFRFFSRVVMGTVILILPFIFKQMGAGDVKIVAAICGYLGIKATVSIAIYFSIIGAVYAGIILYIRYRFPLYIDRFSEYRIPYAVAINFGIIVYYFVGGIF